MLHACDERFDVTENLENFCEMASGGQATTHRLPAFFHCMHCVAKSQTAKRRWPPEEFGSGGSGTQATQDGSLRRRSLHLYTRCLMVIDLSPAAS